MLVAHSKNRKAKPASAASAAIADVLNNVSPAALREYVELIAFPRHYLAERSANVRARGLLIKLLRGFGFPAPRLQGAYDNIVVTTDDNGPYVLLGAHYDSVPGTPGADDNGSAVAVCLECARLIRKHGIGSAMIVFFNREEDGLLGSAEFVAEFPRGRVQEAHVFEMVGYCTREPGSQRLPHLPGVTGPDVGDFLALLANRHSNRIAEELLTLAASYVPESSVMALKVYMGLEKHFGHLNRSDHAPFWQAGIPAIMWTDTSEFRNPHYHRASDTPETLDYSFMAQVTRLAVARTLAEA